MGSLSAATHIYDAFLTKSLGTEQNGMDLSVLSALARAGFDPWAEARLLATLPRPSAVAKIAALLGPAVDEKTAGRLAEALPTVPAAAALPDPVADQRAFLKQHGLLIAAVWLAISVCFTMIDTSSQSAPSATIQAGTLIPR